MDKIVSYVNALLRVRAKPANAKFVGEVGMDQDLAFALKERNKTLAIVALRGCLIRGYGCKLEDVPVSVLAQMVAIGVM